MKQQTATSNRPPLTIERSRTDRRSVLKAASAVTLAPLATCVARAADAVAGPANEADIVIFGATSSGVIAAIQAAKMGKSVILLEPGRHVGGLTTGGLGATDLEHNACYGGLAREFYRRIAQHYAKGDAWFCQTVDEYRKWLGSYHGRRFPKDLSAPGAAMFTFEPKVAQAVYAGMLREAGVTPRLGARLKRPGGVEKRGNRIVAIVLEDGRRIAGKMFIDATYEGDLLAEAGVSFHIGREDNSVYGERWNGAQPEAGGHGFLADVDPYVEPGKPGSGLLWGIDPAPMEKPGTGDRRIQAYNMRLTLTDFEPNRVAFLKPDGYDAKRYEILGRYLATGKCRSIWSPINMPNRKTDTNNHGPMSTDFMGANYDFPEASYAARERSVCEHRDYIQGLLWFVVTDPRTPEPMRKAVGKWGFTKDEFTDNEGWTPQLYVREARRMVGDLVMNDRDCTGDRAVPKPVSMACYGLDSHHARRFVRDGVVRCEGNVQVGGLAPYPVAYGAMTPKEKQCANLLVSVCVSASHIAYGSIRMEPVFQVLGQSAATAAALAIDAGCSVQQLDYAALEKRLLADKQVLSPPDPELKAKPRLRTEVD